MSQTIKSYTVGSSSDCDIMLRAQHVSSQHISITPLENNKYLIKDLDSNYGLWYRGKKVSDVTCSLSDVLQIGRRPVSLQWLAARIFQIEMNIGEENQGDTAIVDTLILGREAPSELIIKHPSVSRRHAEVLFSGGGMMIRDLGSANGTMVNGQTINDWTSITEKDTIRLGGKRISTALLDQWLLKQSAQRSDNHFHAIVSHSLPKEGKVLIGRSPECDIVIDDPTVSWRHAKILISSNQMTVVDLGSSNGTFVDGKAVRRSMITNSNTLQVGQVIIEFTHQGLRSRRDTTVRLDAQNLHLSVQNDSIVLVDDVSVSIMPGEMVALMGPSGAGKTSLLDILSGKRTATKGTVYVNNIPLHKNLSELRHLIGYVPQEDVMHRDLTVFEILYDAAKLKLPADLPNEQIIENVDRLITKMGLAHIRDQLIGDEKNRGISGGQRKRVNIAIELITTPKLIFLDEPTSGLDSKATLELMELLRELADEGRTIVMTIHQPRREAFELLDNLILLIKGGKLAFYSGINHIDEYFATHTGLIRPADLNPADYVLDIIENDNINDDQWQQFYIESIHYKDFLLTRFEDLKEEPFEGQKQKPSFWSQFPVLFSLYTTRKLRDKSTLIIQLLQAPIIGILLAALFPNEGLDFYTKEIPPKLEKITSLVSMMQFQNGIHPTLFLMAASAFWLGCANVARELVAERAIYQRKRRSLLRTSAYLMSIFLYQVLLSVVQMLLLALLTWMTVLPSMPFLKGLSVLLLTAACGISVGLAVSATARNEVSALSVIPLLLIPQLMLGGFIKLYGMLLDSTILSTASDLMPIRWSFELFLHIEYQSAKILRQQLPNQDDLGPLRELSEVIGFDNLQINQPVVALLIITFVNILWAYIWLRKSEWFKE